MRQEAYAVFLAKTRVTYDAILARWNGQRNRDNELRDAIERELATAKHAAGQIKVLGPPSLSTLAEQVMARVKLDRALIYHPSPRLEDTRYRAHLLELAREVGDEPLFAALEAALHESPPNREQAHAALGRLRLDDVWARFQEAAARVVQHLENDDSARRAS
jgi:hypothetical protein